MQGLNHLKSATLKNESVETVHQSKFSKTLRTSLNDDEVFMVVDFSENYQLKYSTEIQSRHFGASNEQLVLHTGAYFLSKTVNDKKDISVSTFCTVSPNNRHDASAIWAHLQPIFVKIKNENNQVTRVHIMSDGPTKQYRNKSNLYLFCHVMQHFGFREASYNFSESGHGKSVADGVGGVVKRTADKAVLAGKDISTIDEFLCCVSMLKTEIIKIEDSSLAVTDQILNAALDTIIPVPNTMKIHQATWNLNEPLNLNCRYLSCEFCRTSSICSHIKTVTHTILKPKETSEEATEDDIAEEPTDDIMEEPGPSSHSNEKTNIEGSCSRLRYHDIYSDSESEDTPNDLVENDFVLIRLATKKSFKHYIGQVRKVYGDRDMDVMFLRKAMGGKFVCPPVEDIASVNYSDIVQVLQQPKVHRGLYRFEGVTDVPNLN